MTLPPPLRAARLAVLAVFFLNGVLVASWFVRIPAVQERLGLGEGSLGVALLGSAVGALAAMPATGWLVSRLGSRPVVLGAGLCLCAALLLPALAPNLLALTLSLVVFGASNGALDVSMNAHGVTVEKGYGLPILSSFHAAFSLGGLAGSALGGLAAAWGVVVLHHFLAVSALALLALVPASLAMLPASSDAGSGRGPAFRWPTRALAGLGVVAFCVLLGEGAMADWSAVYLDDTLGTGPGLAAAGYAAFSVAMTAGRLAGDHLNRRFGPAAVVRSGGALAAVGLGLSLTAANPLAALAGFACAGLGFSAVFPATLSAAGHSPDMPPGSAIAAVSTAGYLGFLVGPPAIGFLAELAGLGGALYLVVALSAAIALLSGAVGRAGKGP
ncbi:Inner membrane protein YbjJ [Rubrobacter xylanophilus DSM 9941]|uniref:MFS transporter n=1 Tax=Rubrobacter xylanophilus TaxID=49319 RepID=UPI001C63C033|nr:MFS transporter [Rubrobacter xylanophilus]QYJ15257.1 Inner membrane protein YbjJ [Rubrobacter xylanophilus DSM 9941]